MISGIERRSSAPFPIIGAEKLPLLEYQRRNGRMLVVVVDGAVGAGKTELTRILASQVIPPVLGLDCCVSQPVFELDWYVLPRAARDNLGDSYYDLYNWFRFKGDDGILSSIEKIIAAMKEKKEAVSLEGIYNHMGEYAGKINPHPHVFPTNRDWLIIEGIFAASSPVLDILVRNKICPLILLTEASAEERAKRVAQRAVSRRKSGEEALKTLRDVDNPSWERYSCNFSTIPHCRIASKNGFFTVEENHSLKAP